ncbi:glycine oxidase ThiO [Gracilibacillus alcaliphilus]|uniref:glycine oxidase ThiO n=1 Tax=Gracilibacillus alcaliphilus TaxID=1401441 RepID=UPI00195A67D3|nr:glycine oxidase [Gracilibacillus alcaliphilus]
MNKRFDQIIVGGGVIGCSIAYQLAKRGYQVLVVEANQIGSEASSAAAGMLGAQAEFTEDSPLFRLAQESRALFQNLSEELQAEAGIDIQYIHKGMLKLAYDQQQYQQLELMAMFQQAMANPAYLLSAEEARKKEPGLSKDVIAALFLPDDGQVSARHITKAFSLAAIHRGAVLHEQERVNNLLVERKTVRGVQTAQAVYYADQVIITTGAFGDELLAPHYTTRPVKGECLALELEQPLFQSTISMAGCYLVPKHGRKVIVGATSIPGQTNKRVSAAGIHHLLTHAQQMMPQLSAAKLDCYWAGVRPATDDGNPYLGQVPGVSGLYTAKGHYRNGILLSPITGHYMADIIENKPVDPLYEENFKLDRQVSHKLEKAGEWR